jgi:hypothetical protein
MFEAFERAFGRRRIQRSSLVHTRTEPRDGCAFETRYEFDSPIRRARRLGNEQENGVGSDVDAGDEAHAVAVAPLGESCATEQRAS